MTAPAPASRHDVDRLNPDLIAQLRDALVQDLAAQQRHVAELRRTAESLMGQLDSDSLLERELARDHAVQGLEAIAAIEDALTRIDAGTYGRCDRCGETIAPARLEALPHTRHCVSCPPQSARLIG
jgi:RNA polymerase-binding transcription factor DksA